MNIGIDGTSDPALAQSQMSLQSYNVEERFTVEVALTFLSNFLRRVKYDCLNVMEQCVHMHRLSRMIFRRYFGKKCSKRDNWSGCSELFEFAFLISALRIKSAIVLHDNDTFVPRTFVLITLKPECTSSFRWRNAWMLLLWWSSQTTFRNWLHMMRIAGRMLIWIQFLKESESNKAHCFIASSTTNIAFFSLRSQSKTRFNKTITQPNTGAFRRIQGLKPYPQNVYIKNQTPVQQNMDRGIRCIQSCETTRCLRIIS